MSCPDCGRDARQDAAFCDGCGASLTPECRACARQLRPGAQFCDGCGQPIDETVPGAPERDPRAYTPKHLVDKILQSKSALEGERKQVTVLFADVKGSTDLAEQIDPEEWHTIMDRFFEILTDGVHRFEGTVNQYTGDGIMALFGAPIAHEDHAQRACYAALRLRDELRRYGDELRVSRGLSLSCRIGLNSGEVVVGKIGDDLRMDYTAQGHTVNLAARMEGLAEPGKVFLTGETGKLVGDYFTLRSLGDTEVKGAAAPLAIFELTDVGALRTRLDVSRARGFSRFVGRPDEMATLDAALARAIEGQGQVVGVVADAGIGKSRLCFEFVERCRARGTEVYEAHCLVHARTVPFLPILELLRGYFGIGEKDAPDQARTKVAGTLLLLDDGFRQVLPLVFDFLGVPDPEQPAPRMEPEIRQRQLFDFVRRLVQASVEPVVVFFDDLHWVDPGSDAFVEQLVEVVTGTNVLLLVNFRPEYEAEWFRKPYYQQIALMPLGPEAIEELLLDLLGRDPSVGGLTKLIRERTGGNPFFIEELVHALAESGSLEGTRGAHRLTAPIEELEVPPTVQAVLASRIDRLAEREKQVLQTAAVIGRVFSEPILASVTGVPEPELADALRALKDGDFIYEQSVYPVAEYIFKHPLTEAVALGSQLQARRSRTHEAVARAIEEVAGDKIEEQAALVAHHWDEAGRADEAARWHARAAEWIGVNDYAEAHAHWHRAYELLRPLAPTPETDALAAGACHKVLVYAFRLGIPEEEARQLRAEGDEICERTGDLHAHALLVTASSAIEQSLGDMAGYVETAKEAIALADRTGDPALRAAVLVDVVWSSQRAGLLSEALDAARTGLELTDRDAGLGAEFFGYSPYIMLLFMQGWVQAMVGQLEEGERTCVDAIDLARRYGPQESVEFTLVGQARIARLKGNARESMTAAREMLELAESLATATHRVMALQCFGTALALAGELSEAIDVLEQTLTLSRKERVWQEEEAEILTELADAHLRQGESARARELGREAVAAARRGNARPAETHALIGRARVLLSEADPASLEEARAALREAERIVEETGLRVWLPHIAIERATLSRLGGDEAASHELLQEAHRLFTEMGATGYAERLARELGS